MRKHSYPNRNSCQKRTMQQSHPNPTTGRNGQRTMCIEPKRGIAAHLAERSSRSMDVLSLRARESRQVGYLPVRSDVDPLPQLAPIVRRSGASISPTVEEEHLS
jgi:hypothetical protein